jgi:hypothetical protein
MISMLLERMSSLIELAPLILINTFKPQTTKTINLGLFLDQSITQKSLVKKTQKWTNSLKTPKSIILCNNRKIWWPFKVFPVKTATNKLCNLWPKNKWCSNNSKVTLMDKKNFHQSNLLNGSLNPLKDITVVNMQPISLMTPSLSSNLLHKMLFPVKLTLFITLMEKSQKEKKNSILKN